MQIRWPGVLPKVLATWMIFPYDVFWCQSRAGYSQTNFSLHLHTELTHPCPKLSLFPSLSAGHKGAPLMAIGVS